ncbi:MAG TPA: hypothetical protein VHY33_15245 [Thermoanaerobaculia bacterium]|jgi:hypothetical protein|nr:hypothetical protein [Thermoanaerobaculia bacterium]
MTKKVSESRASLPRRRDRLSEAFVSITPDAAAFVEDNPALRAKVLRAAERLAEAFPGHPLHLVLAFDHESGDRDLFIEFDRRTASVDDLFAFEREWIRDREDPDLEVNFGFFHR